MAYSIEVNSIQKVVLRRRPFRGKNFIYVVLWSFAILGGFLFLLSIADSGSEDSLKFKFISLACSSLGVLGLYSLNYFLSLQNFLLPEFITFDNDFGVVKIEQEKNSNQTAYIPFDELEKFDIRKQTDPEEINRNIFHIVLIKKDGGSIGLIRETNEEIINKQLAELQSSINFKNPVSSTPQPILTEKIMKEERSDVVYLRWKNPARKNIQSLIISSSLVYLTLIGFLQIAIADDAHMAAKLLIIFMLIGVTVSILSRVRVIYKDIRLTFGISIGKSSIEYFEENKDGAINYSIPITLKEIHGIVFNFYNEAPESFLRIESKEEYKIRKQRESDLISFDFIKRSLGITTGKIVLNTRALNTIEKIQLENWIQNVLKERSGLSNL